MSLTSESVIHIGASATAGPLSRVRKQFNSLIKKLETERIRLALWHEEIPGIFNIAASDYNPLARTFRIRRRQMLLLLDQACADKTMSKKDREKLADMICSIALGLMQLDDGDEEVKAIYNRHSGIDFDLEQASEKAFMLDMMSAVTGVKLDEDTDLSSPQAIFEAMQEKLDARQQEEAQEQMQGHEQEQERAAQARSDKPARPAKVSARDARQQAEEFKLKQSVRDIFRKLASALHPDRETDPAERERKTALMQPVNAAHAANDLLGLLELQLEVDQIDQTGLNNLDDDRIRQYNRILTGQLEQIKSEIGAQETAIALDMGWEPGRHRTPTAMRQALRADIAGLRTSVKYIEEDLETFSDLRKLKIWLKSYKIVASPDYEDRRF